MAWPTRAELAGYLQEKGVEPRVRDLVLYIQSVESSDGRPGDNNTSFGPFQLHYGGRDRVHSATGLGDTFTKRTGLDARDENTWRQQADFVVGEIGPKQNDWAALKNIWHALPAKPPTNLSTAERTDVSDSSTKRDNPYTPAVKEAESRLNRSRTRLDEIVSDEARKDLGDRTWREWFITEAMKESVTESERSGASGGGLISQAAGGSTANPTTTTTRTKTRSEAEKALSDIQNQAQTAYNQDYDNWAGALTKESQWLQTEIEQEIKAGTTSAAQARVDWDSYWEPIKQKEDSRQKQLDREAAAANNIRTNDTNRDNNLLTNATSRANSELSSATSLGTDAGATVRATLPHLVAPGSMAALDRGSNTFGGQFVPGYQPTERTPMTVDPAQIASIGRDTTNQVLAGRPFQQDPMALMAQQAAAAGPPIEEVMRMSPDQRASLAAKLAQYTLETGGAQQ